MVWALGRRRPYNAWLWWWLVGSLGLSYWMKPFSWIEAGKITMATTTSPAPMASRGERSACLGRRQTTLMNGNRMTALSLSMGASVRASHEWQLAQSPITREHPRAKQPPTTCLPTALEISVRAHTQPSVPCIPVHLDALPHSETILITHLYNLSGVIKYMVCQICIRYELIHI